MNLNTSVFHWKLNTPIIIASSPFGKDANTINKMFHYGAGAVITKTISNIECKNKGVLKFNNHIFNRDGYSTETLEDWDNYLEELRNKKVIANICANSPKETAKLAKFVVERGVEVIELGISCPTFGGDPICFNSNLLEDFCKEVRKAVSIPIIAKILVSTSKEYNIKLVNKLKDIGIDGISLSDSLPSLLIDSSKNNMQLGGTGGISGPMLKPLVLKAIYDIRDIGLPIIGIGGIETANDIIDYISVGATAVEICSVLFNKKASYISSINTDLENYMLKKGVNLNELRRSIL